MCLRVASGRSFVGRVALETSPDGPAGGVGKEVCWWENRLGREGGEFLETDW